MMRSMLRFARLIEELDTCAAPADAVAALVRYFARAEPADAAWALHLLSGGQPRRLVARSVLREAACRQAGVDDWLFAACRQTVGELAETIALVLPARPDHSPTPQTCAGLAAWVEQALLPLRGLAPAEQAERLARHWDALDAPGRLVHARLVDGGRRLGVSRLLLQRALAQHAGLGDALVAQRLAAWGDARTRPSAACWLALLEPPRHEGGHDQGQPYPFMTAQVWADAPDALGACERWQVEWLYAGLRCQLVKRTAQLWLWLPGDELVTARFPEVAAAAAGLADGTVLDGVLLAWLPGSPAPAPAPLLQQRLQGKASAARGPVRLLAFDVLQAQGVDVRERPLKHRRAVLERLLADTAPDSAIAAAPLLQARNAAGLAVLRSSAGRHAALGLVLKDLDSPYSSQGADGPASWFECRAEPTRVAAVLVYAQAGQGRQAGAFADYSFALWSQTPAHADEAQAAIDAMPSRQPPDGGAPQLLVFAKVDAGVQEEDGLTLERVIRATALHKFGPVRSVRPTLVCEIAVEGVQRSARHKCGVLVRSARLLRICHDRLPWQADALPTLLQRSGLAEVAATIDPLHPTRRGAP